MQTSYRMGSQGTFPRNATEPAAGGLTRKGARDYNPRVSIRGSECTHLRLSGREAVSSTMILQSTDQLEEQVGNKYSLVIVAAKRARQIREGHTTMVRETSPSFLTVAMREIQEERVRAIAPVEDDLPAAPREVISSLVAGTEFDLEDEIDLEETDAVDDLAALLAGSAEADEDDEERDSDTDATRAAGMSIEDDPDAADEDDSTEDDTDLEDDDESEDE